MLDFSQTPWKLEVTDLPICRWLSDHNQARHLTEWSLSMPINIANDIYLIKIPLPNNPLKDLNSYLIKGEERNLLIDTGFNLDACCDVMISELRSLGVDMSRTDIFLTHFHADHSGLCGRIAHPDTKIYLGIDDCRIMQGTHKMIKDNIPLIMSMGIPAHILQENAKVNPSIIYRPAEVDRLVPLEDGHLLTVGNYHFEAIHTPGHTPGHMCLYDRAKKMLFCGDHIIFDITPNISIWPDMPNALNRYMESLRAVNSLDVDLALSAHRNPEGNIQERIDSLLLHHEKRLDEVSEIVKAYPGSNCYEVASKMRWKIRAPSWDDFPTSQKWFAIAEAAAHLEYLVTQGKLKSATIHNVMVFE